MAIFQGIQEYIARDGTNIAIVFDSGKIVSISGNIFLYHPQGLLRLDMANKLNICPRLKSTRFGILYRPDMSDS